MSVAAARAAIESLDHLVIAVRDLDAAVETYAKLLGRAPSWRGTHPQQGTANALYRLDNTYVELLAATAEGGLADAVRAHLDARGEGLAALALGTHDLAGLLRAWREAGLRLPLPQSGRGRDDESGAERVWRSVVLPSEMTRGVALFVIEHGTPSAALRAAPAQGDAGAAVDEVDHVVVMSSDADSSHGVYGELLGLRLALDRTFEERGLRLLFFRVGGVTIEMSAPLAAPVDRSRDALWGVAYRCGDVAAAQKRLSAAGFDVSQVRDGHKPGTIVCTVRAETHGVATLLIGPRPA